MRTREELQKVADWLTMPTTFINKQGKTCHLTNNTIEKRLGWITNLCRGHYSTASFNATEARKLARYFNMDATRSIPTLRNDLDSLFARLQALVDQTPPEKEVKHQPQHEKENVTTVTPATVDKSAAQASAVIDLSGLTSYVDQRIEEKAADLKPTRVVHAVQVNDQEPVEVEGVLPDQYGSICTLIGARKNIMLVGPTGCGKSHVAVKAAEGMQMRYAVESMSGGASESVLQGYLLPTGDAGRFEYHASQFVDLYENGGVMILEEVDGADPNVLLILNNALANGSMSVPQRLGNTVINRHPDFVCICIANTFGHGADRMYAGRMQQDAAFLDRFRIGMVELDYSKQVEESLVDTEVLVWGRAVRKCIEDNRLRRALSTRFLRDASDMKRHGWTMTEIKAAFFRDWDANEKAMAGA